MLYVRIYLSSFLCIQEERVNKGIDSALAASGRGSRGFLLPGGARVLLKTKSVEK